ncbi:MAG: hypothetical protein K9M45_10390 [Kiritimatiellales bacterium]|nr:hypothetical protein [Kiritimatiellales bacterium]
MKNKQPTPLQASFWLTLEERVWLAVILAIALFGLTVRYFYLKNTKATVYTPAEIEETESTKK